MSALGWLLLLGGVVAAVWVMRRPGTPPLDEARDTGNAPVDEYLLEDLARHAGVLNHGGSHEDLPLTTAERLALFRRAEDILNPPAVPVIPGREEN